MVTTTKIFLVANDPSLLKPVQSVIDSIPGCSFEQIPPPSIDDIPSLLTPDVGFVLLHHDSSVSESLLRAFLSAATQPSRRVPVIVISEESQSAMMVQWFRLGAMDCLSRPMDLTRLSFLLDSLTLRIRREGNSRWIRDGDSPLCVASRATEQFIAQARKAASRKANILITGETGTGKTHIARMIHSFSSRSGQPFLAVNCAAIPETLIESELFGHVRGAFTGADKDQVGMFSQIGNGTLFLDEVDALPLSSQSKLLHVVDGGTFFPVGTRQAKDFKGCLIAASNQDLLERSRSGLFRNDLYYRLGVLELHVPPLRERRAEIPLLAEEYIRLSAERTHDRAIRLSPNALKEMHAYDWPGNVRQLYNLLEQALTFCDGDQIDEEDILSLLRGRNRSQQPPLALPIQSQTAKLTNSCLQPLACNATTGTPLELARAEGEIELIRQLLEANSHNRAATARQLGISRSAFYKRMTKLGLSTDR